MGWWDERRVLPTSPHKEEAMTNTTASSNGRVSLTPWGEGDDVNPRSQRARSERMAVAPLGGGLYEVSSQSGNTYTVDLPGGRCTCPDHMMRGVRCKHIRRVAMEINEGRVPPPGKEVAECTSCGDTVFVDENAPGPHLCADCEIRPGDPVVDRETGDLLVAVNVTDRRANEVQIPDRDCTVADYPTNADYDPRDPVVEVLYPLPAGVGPDDVKPHHMRRYSFPLSRLERRTVETADQSELSDFAVAE